MLKIKNEIQKKVLHRKNVGKLFFYLFIFLMVGTVSFLIIEFFHFQFDFSRLINFLTTYKKLSALSIGIILLFQLPLFIIVGNIWVGTLLSTLISLTIAFVNFQKMLYRPEPLYPADFAMLKDLKFLFISIELKDRILFITAFLILILIIFFVFRTTFRDKKWTKEIIFKRTIGTIFSIVLLIPVLYFGSNESKIKNLFEEYGHASWVPFNQIKNYDRNGVVAGLLYNLSSQVMERPEGYSKERVTEIVNKYKQIAEKENEGRTGTLDDTNIVFIMNESFSDPMEFKGMTIKPEPLPNYREIIKEASSGKMLSQGYGGGTANIEFEALTGISLEPMLPNISVAYTQLTSKMKSVPSILTYFNNMENDQRKKTAIHPFQSSMYRRPEVYSHLGFDKMIFEDDMEFEDKLESSLYISDQASYKQLFKVMKETEEKDFIHLVTMQGHGPYHVGYFGNTQGFEVEGPVNKMDVLNYLSSLSYSDDALKVYVDEVNSMDEKVITVFWGDHLPSAIGEGITSINDSIMKYLTPVFIYANFETAQRDLKVISPMYYMNELLEMTDSRLNGYYALLFELRKHLPAFEKTFHLYSEIGDTGIDRYSGNMDADEILKEYDMLIYDIFDGEHFFEKSGFFDDIN